MKGRHIFQRRVNLLPVCASGREVIFELAFKLHIMYQLSLLKFQCVKQNETGLGLLEKISSEKKIIVF